MTLKQFEKLQYLNIETFRKNGQGVKTPVWFVQDGEALHIWTFAEAGKIKRIHRDSSVRIVPSTVSGESLGEWVNAQAVAYDSEDAIQLVERLMKKKYGFSFFLFSGFGKIRKSRAAVIKITVP